MSNFHAFLTQKYPLYSDTEIKVNLTVQQLCELVEEFINQTAPVFEVKERKTFKQRLAEEMEKNLNNKK